MNAPSALPGGTQQTGWRNGLAYLAVVALWLPLLVRLSRAWRAEPDQAYGWAVPVLALYLAWERWRTSSLPPDRFLNGGPDLVSGGSGNREPKDCAASREVRPSIDPENNTLQTTRPDAREPSAGGRVVAWVLLAGACLTMAPLLTVLEANPLWPTAQWLGAGAAVLATLAAMSLLGGGRWAAHFAFPAGFVLTALTWPAMLRGGLFGLLAPFNADIAAELVSAGGHPAVATGNVIEVAGGLVGVDEACSGLRSVQAAVMIGVFFGEFYRLGVVRRISLVLGALGLAMVGNLARTTFLAWQAASHGIEAVGRWHDLAGGIVLLVVMAGTAGVAAWLARRSTLPVARAIPSPMLKRGGATLAAVVVMAGVFSELAARGWYVWRDHWQGIERVQWALNTPADGWTPVTLPKASQDLLRCSDIQGFAHGNGATTADSLAYVLRWDGDVTLTDEWHSPSICLPASGAQLDGEAAPLEMTLAGVPVSFSHYRFKVGEQVEHVFFMRWDEREARPLAAIPPRISDVVGYRLRRVLEGRRRADVEQLTFVVLAGTAAEAERWARTTIPQLLRRAE